MMNVFVFGNELVAPDARAKRLADLIRDDLPGVTFVMCDDPGQLLDRSDKELVILDVVENTDEVVLLRDVDRLASRRIVSLHDFDLAFFLKLMERTGDIEGIVIIGIPLEGALEGIKGDVCRIILELSAS